MKRKEAASTIRIFLPKRLVHSGWYLGEHFSLIHSPTVIPLQGNNLQLILLI